MTTFITTVFLGISIVVLGVINMTGNISSLHWYHRKRVTEENRKPFGKLIGTGTLVCGIAMILFGSLFLVYETTQLAFLLVIATAELLMGIIIGLAISLYAMIKYNKGIF